MRLLSLIVAAGFIAFHSFGAQPLSIRAALGTALPLFISVLFPLACIWFGEEMGDYVGMLPGPGISKTTPEGLVKAGGWVLLVMVIIVWTFILQG